MSLFGLNPEKGGFAITGTAPTHGAVLQYARAVRDSGHFGDAQVIGLEGLGGENGGEVTFRILATDILPPSDGGDEDPLAAASEIPSTAP